MVLTEEQKKINKSISKKKYDDANKEKRKQYYLDNKEKILEQKKQYGLNNKEKITKQKKQYRLDNPKSKIISNWKFNGIIDDDWDGLYEYFIKETKCMICDKLYNKDIKIDLRCLEHDHDITDDNNVRYICCVYCNLHIIK